jgi:hypothetical protein
VAVKGIGGKHLRMIGEKIVDKALIGIKFPIRHRGGFPSVEPPSNNAARHTWRLP